MVEASFKAFARALREAIADRPDACRASVHQGPACESALAILDYGMGNLRSVEKALEHVARGPSMTRDHARVRAATASSLPGVGAFPKAMEAVRELGLDELLARAARRAGVPVLGICLGMQLLFEAPSELAAPRASACCGRVEPRRAS